MWCPGVCPSVVSAVNTAGDISQAYSERQTPSCDVVCAPLWSQAGNYGKYKSAIGLGEKPEGSVLCKGPGSF